MKKVGGKLGFLNLFSRLVGQSNNYFPEILAQKKLHRSAV